MGRVFALKVADPGPIPGISYDGALNLGMILILAVIPEHRAKNKYGAILGVTQNKNERKRKPKQFTILSGDMTKDLQGQLVKFFSVASESQVNIIVQGSQLN